MKFNTQVCTTREQSERLLALGLKKETADMYLTRCFVGNNGTPMVFVGNTYKPSTVLFSKEDIPAWSLHRLISITPDTISIDDNEGEWGVRFYINKHMAQYDSCPIDVMRFENRTNLYDKLIDCIEWFIKGNHFNKQYLNQDL